MWKQTKYNRTDITRNLPHGALVNIANRFGCSKSYVTSVLSGKKKAVSILAIKIVDAAQIIAAVNIWNVKYCKFRITLNPLEI